MQEKNRRFEILELIQQGDLKPEEGLILLKALEASAPAVLTGAGSPAGPSDSSPLPSAQIPQPDLSGTTADASPAVEPDLSGADLSALDPVPSAPSAAAESESTEPPAADPAPAGPPPERAAGEVLSPADDESLRRMEQLRRLSWIPLGVGIFILLISAYWMYSGFLAAGLGLGFWLSWLPFLVGLAILYLGFEGLHSVWLHVRVRQKAGHSPANIHISMPLPLGLLSWVMRVFGDRIPRPGNQDLGQILNMVHQGITRETPLYVHVNGDDDEQVEVYIG